MAIAFDTSKDLGNWTQTGSNSITVGSLTNGVLLIPIVGDITSGNDDISAVTVGGSNATLITKLTGPQRFLYLYIFLLGTTSGSKTVAVSSTNSHLLIVGAASYQGVNQSTTVDNVGTGSITTNTIFPLTLSPVASNCFVCMMASKSFDGNAMSAGTASTLRVQDATFNDWGWLESSSNPVSGSTTVRATESTNDNWGGIIISLAPAGAGPSFNPGWAYGATKTIGGVF